MRYKVLTAVTMKIMALQKMPYTLVHRYQNFRVTRYLHLQGRRVNPHSTLKTETAVPLK
jgi:hypothetical protein